MEELLTLLSQLRNAQLQLIFVYLHEAHADDVWPLGYGICSHTSIEERWAACDAMLNRHPALRDAVDDIVVDSMTDDFLHTNGAWPERYFFVDAEGRTLWSSQVATEDSQKCLADAHEFAVSQKWL